MKFVEPSYEVIHQCDEGDKIHLLFEMYKHIELCGRTCYKSTDKIGEDTAVPFVERMIASKHNAMLEHGTIYLTVPRKEIAKMSENDITVYGAVTSSPHSKLVIDKNGVEYCTVNFRTLIENNGLDLIKYMSIPTSHHEKRYTVKFVTNIQVYKEYTRHRVFSWAIESTRYCNYLKNRFGGCLTFINPLWLDDSKWYQKLAFKTSLWVAEKAYLFLIKTGWQPQEAANLLPQATKAEVIMTGFADDFKHFFDLRAVGTTGKPHPQAQQLAKPLMNHFISQHYI